jgi:hypothetical protein
MKPINLIDYLDRPELIQDINGGRVKALHHFPDNSPIREVLVVFEDGEAVYFRKEGIHANECESCFCLVPQWEVVNLIDYLDKPELIQDSDGGRVKALYHFPNENQYNKILVVFENGTFDRYSVNGRYDKDCKPCFYLIPSEK